MARLIAAVILLWALLPNPYGFYMLVRLVVCGVCGYTKHFIDKQLRFLYKSWTEHLTHSRDKRLRLAAPIAARPHWGL